MKMKKCFGRLVGPKEAVRITEVACTISDANIALDVFRAWTQRPQYARHKDDFVEQASALTAVFMAGMVQGIRQERLRRAERRTAHEG